MAFIIGSQRRSGEPKQVMFSDGIRPGGDLTELDGAEQARAPRRSVRTARKATQQQQSKQALISAVYFFSSFTLWTNFFSPSSHF